MRVSRAALGSEAATGARFLPGAAGRGRDRGGHLRMFRAWPPLAFVRGEAVLRMDEVELAA